MRQLLPEPLRNFTTNHPSWRRMVQAPREHAHAVHDVETMNLIYTQQVYIASAHLHLINGKQGLELSLAAVEDVRMACVGMAFSTGIHAFAAMSRPLDVPPRPHQLSANDLSRGIDATLDDDSELGRAARAAIGQLEGLDELISATAVYLVKELIGYHAELAPAREELLRLLYTAAQVGARTEFLYTRFAAEHREGVGMIERLVQKVTGRSDVTSPETLRALTDAVGLPDEIHPWPRDRRCLCGKSLDPYIFCCKPEAPFDIGPYVPQLAPGFVLERPCCGDRYEGFRCDACGRVSAWAQGVVDTHLEAEEADDE